MGWVVAILLTATTTSGRTAWVLYAFFSFGQIPPRPGIRRCKAARRLLASSSVPGSLSRKITWGLEEQITPPIELTGLKTDLLSIPNVIEFKK
jgi:hypothetical protein